MKSSLLPTAVVQISIPSGSQWYARFSMCLIHLILDSVNRDTPGWDHIDITTRNIRGSVIWKQRAELLQKAIDGGCTHALFLDVDQTFPPNLLRRLLSHKEPIVAANVAVKEWPSMPTARVRRGTVVEPVYTLEDSEGLEEVWRVGTGIMLVDLKILKDVKKPWFQVSWGDKPEDDQYGEDWWFCKQVQEAGYSIYIDHDVSWEVGHIGDFQYNHWHVSQELREEVSEILKTGTQEEKRTMLAAATHRLEAKAMRDLMPDETAG